ncbi:MAG: PD-(D/E)XK nuclease family protein, partial [Candidatus Nanohaloarchaea archaeon]
GLLHDAVQELYRKELEFEKLDQDPDTGEILAGLVRGEEHTELDGVDRRWNSLWRELDPSTVLDRNIYGESLHNLVKEIARNRKESPDAAEIVENEFELQTSAEVGNGYTVGGRADRVVGFAGEQRDTEVWEQKIVTRGSDLPRQRHLYQAGMYAYLLEEDPHSAAWIEDPQPYVDYPVQGSRIPVRSKEAPSELGVSEVEDMMEEDIRKLESQIGELQEEQIFRIEDRTGLRKREEEDLRDFRNRVDTSMNYEIAETQVEEATREALEEVL